MVKDVPVPVFLPVLVLVLVLEAVQVPVPLLVEPPPPHAVSKKAIRTTTETETRFMPVKSNMLAPFYIKEVRFGIRKAALIKERPMCRWRSQP